MKTKDKPPQYVRKVSKFLSYILRHNPQAIGLGIDGQGWADIDELIRLANGKNKRLNREKVLETVRWNDKKRFAISDDGSMIRARQGHSIPVDLGLTSVEPPGQLFHGTTERFLASILSTGLIPKSRRHVHLSSDIRTAVRVGARHGKPVILLIDASAMFNQGFEFFLSENNIWLTAAVPPDYLSVHS